MNIFAVALAEQTAEVTVTPQATDLATEFSNAIQGMTQEQAASAGMAAGAVIGIGVGMIAILALAWFILQAIADWKIFEKAGEPGWKSLIPIYNVIVEYDISWNGYMGMVYMILTGTTTILNISGGDGPSWLIFFMGVLSIVALVIYAMQSLKLARCFGKSTLFGVLLILFGPIARMILGFGKARYLGNR